LRRSDADTRTACGLHTHKLWESHADPDGDSNCNTDGNGDGNGDDYAEADTYAKACSNTAATPDAAAASVDYSRFWKINGNWRSNSPVPESIRRSKVERSPRRRVKALAK